MNTAANWSAESTYLARKTPYVVAIHIPSRRLQGAMEWTPYWGAYLVDPFDPDLEKNLRARLERERDTSAGDPWCIGYFIHNELHWGNNDAAVGWRTLTCPPDQPAKRVFVNDLRAKYETIEELNEAWGMSFDSWGALLSNRSGEVHDWGKVGPDFAAFTRKLAEQYFSTCRRVVKQVAPDQLYLGARFSAHHYSSSVVEVAARHCDVLSYNVYWFGPGGFSNRSPEGLDKPVIMGEFTFVARNRGLRERRGWGVSNFSTQEARADAYRQYMGEALGDPLIVGVHWFQYADQATTGRGDGENASVGFVDVCDTPYPEMVEAAREMAYGMYGRRLGVADESGSVTGQEDGVSETGSGM
jgi:hypothetical protein